MKKNIENMRIPEPRNMVPRIFGTMENSSEISRYYFLRFRESYLSQNMERDQVIPFPEFHMAIFNFIISYIPSSKRLIFW